MCGLLLRMTAKARRNGWMMTAAMQEMRMAPHLYRTVRMMLSAAKMTTQDKRIEHTMDVLRTGPHVGLGQHVQEGKAFAPAPVTSW